MDTIIEKVRRELLAASDEKVRESSRRFFKENERAVVYGVKTAVAAQIGKENFLAVKGKSKREIFELCEQLWQSGVVEESFIACTWSSHLYKQYEPADFVLFEKWVDRYVDNWASCDTLCNHTVGSFIERFPAFLAELKKWAISANRWMRRAAAVSLIVPARKGMFLPDIFEIADILLTDNEDLVQKGYGWMLKVASQQHPEEVFDYVMRQRAIMPRTALRYAIEKMPPEWKARAMEKPR